MSTSSPVQENEAKDAETATREDHEHISITDISLKEEIKDKLIINPQISGTNETKNDNLMEKEIDGGDAQEPVKEENLTADESIECNSSPDNEIRTNTASIFNPRTFKSPKPQKYFTQYTNLINTQKQYQFRWDKTLKKRLEQYNDSPNNVVRENETVFENPPKIEAAPFPLLPSKQEVEAVIQELDDEIAREKNKLRELIILHNTKAKSVQSLQKLKNKKGIRNCFGNILTQNTFDRVKQQNLSKLKQTHQKNVLKNEQIIGKYKRIGDLPHFFMDNSFLQQPILNYLTHRRIEENKYNQQLATEYAKIRGEYDIMSDALSEYHKEYKAAVHEWPPEFKYSVLKPTELSEVQPYCAPDVNQYKLEEEQECFMYYDENMLVEDPVKEHEMFKRRLAWTDDEKKIFYEKYGQHPREFKKIANALPGKSTKDVIEFYFLNRLPMNLHELDVRARTKGHHKKVISEGSSKK